MDDGKKARWRLQRMLNQSDGGEEGGVDNDDHDEDEAKRVGDEREGTESPPSKIGSQK